MGENENLVVNPVPVRMSGRIGRIEPFDNTSETWDAYEERLEQYFICNEVPNPKKVSVLVTLIGGSTYQLLRNLTAPRKPSEETYDDLVRKLREHLCRKPLVIAERFRFHKREQGGGETVREYIAALRKGAVKIRAVFSPESRDLFLAHGESYTEKHESLLKYNVFADILHVLHYVKELLRADFTPYLNSSLSEHCDFGTHLNDSLRDRLVCGLRNEQIQKKLLSESDLTLDKATEIAIAMETAARDAVELQAKHQSASVHKLKPKRDQKPRDKHKTFRSSDKQHRSSANQPKCFRCRGQGHDPNDCFYKDKECFKCGNKGHAQRACPKRKKKRIHALGDETDSDSDSDALIKNLSVKSLHEVISIPIELNGRPMKMELDTSAAVSVMPKKKFRENFANVKIYPSDITLKTYSGEELKPAGYALMNVKYHDQVHTLKLYVLQKGKSVLLGRDWLSEIKLNWPELGKISATKEKQTMSKNPQLQDILDKHAAVFNDEWGTLRDIKAKLRLKADATPKFTKARSVAHALKERVNRELDKLVDDGVLEKCDYSEWATPIVPIPKKDGSVRICGDFKVTVNPMLEVDQYPLPRIEDVFAALAGGQHFTKIDLRHAFLQMEVDEVSKPLLTINTEKGLYRFKRLLYGVASAPAIWQRSIDIVLQGLSGVKCVIDDMVITGRTEEEHLRNLDAVLTRLEQYGLRANMDKCQFFASKIEFCGYEIDRLGLHKTQKKIEAVLNAPVPTNVTELRSFLGIVNYYARFLPNMSAVLHPLYQLLQKGCTWNWSDDCQKSIEKIKELITSDEVLTHYDPDLPLSLATDASPFGLGAVLSHTMPDGSERPIAYASKSLSPAEKNYSQIEKEALGIVWGVKKFNTYLFGRHFRLVTDHQPLTSIFSPSKGISNTSAARLQRYALFLAGYDYNILYRSTKKHGNADTLSRLPLNSQELSDTSENAEIDALYISQLEHFPVSSKIIQRETTKDVLLSKVHNFVTNGWPTNSDSKEFDPYFSRRTEITPPPEYQMDHALWGIRIIVPPSLRKKILKELHQGHIGIVKTKSLARSYVWWPGIDTDIENYCKKCEGCQLVKTAPQKAPIHPWEFPSQPWERIHIDFAGPFLNHMFLIIVDAHSKWPEVVPMKKTTSTNTIDALRSIFARFGLPSQIVSDNGPQFTSEEFKSFVKANIIKHITSALYHPSTNGLAERFVQTFKLSMKSCKRESGSIIHKFSKFLLSYRNTPQSTTNESPAKLLLGHTLHTRLDLVKPDVRRSVKEKQFIMQERRKSKTRSFTPGETVTVRDYRKGHDHWTTGTVLDQTGPVSYRVEITPGFTWRRHTDQIRSTTLSHKPVDIAASHHEIHPPDQGSNQSVSIPLVSDLPSTPSSASVTSPSGSLSQDVPIKSPERRYPTRDRKAPEYLKDYVRNK
ncbi:hypothetical protein FSP39_022706 [Pinctada imbricata]|uniref:Endonuclease n=1 Tax=Pinctada imbricata TaxID=66713 RepID=A0AA88YFD2_PINIB|nr:hypothetical protein FSP39_022706 [Pinctada imbricata]